MTFLANRNNGIFYIAEDVKGKRIYHKSLGRISKEEAQNQLAEWKEVHVCKKANPMPREKFDVLYSDPPWRYDFSSTTNRKIENQYQTMDVEDICALKVPAADNCICFLWATAPKLLEALKVMEAWKFEYKTCAVWDKKRTGMGYYFRGQHELLLVGTKGKPGTPAAPDRLPSVIESIRTEHSAKPDIVYEMIEKMYPGRSYIELFARKKFSDRWTVWGNEV